MNRVYKILLLMAVGIIMSGCGFQNLDKLAAFGEEQFLQNDYDSYIRNLRAASGLDDLKADVTVSYSEERGYDKATKTLNASCVLTLYSDEINQYYTKDYNSEKAEELMYILTDLKDECSKATIYEYQSGDSTVKISVSSGTSEYICVNTSQDREYTFDCYGGYDSVMIDRDYVYMNKVKGDDNTSSTYTGSYDAKLIHGSGAIVAFTTEDAMERFTSAMVKDQQETIDTMVISGEVIYVEKYTKCNVITKKLTKAQVTLLEGSYSGKTVWVAIEAVQ